MRKFIIRITHFSLAFIPIFCILPLLFLINDFYQDWVLGNEVYYSIRKSKQKSDNKILVIGDSIGWQFFTNKSANDSINSFACNQAIGVVGHYLILKNHLETGSKPEIVYMLYNPFSFMNNLNQIYTFNYFLKPFYKEEYKDEFSPIVFEQINKIPFAEFSQEPYVLLSNWSPDFKPSDEIDYTFLSPISADYLEKIKTLCYSKGVKLQIIPMPVKKSDQETIDKFDSNEFAGLLVEKELQFYLNNIIYLEDSAFRDGVHLKNPEENKEQILFLMEKAQIAN